MSEVTAAAPLAKKKRSRIGELIGVLVIIGIIVAAAFFQESISAFFNLKLWDKGAPSRTVEQFLAAGRKGDKPATQALIGPGFQELNKDGKWLGYSVVSMAGTMEYDFNELAPQGEPKAEPAEFLTIGKGSAEVKAADSTGKPVKYRLEMIDGRWKITEILGGHPAAKAPAPAKPSGAKPGSK